MTSTSSSQLFFMGNVSSFLNGNNVHHHHQQETDAFEEESKPSKAPKREKRKYRCRKRSPATIERAKTVRRDKANARERRRMNSLNDALEHLRTILPALPDEPKMTKIETLRKAQEYIAQLSYQLSSSPESVGEATSISPIFSSCGEHNSSASCSVQSTPFQSPCFPQPSNQIPYQINHHLQLNHHHNHYTHSPHISSYFPSN